MKGNIKICIGGINDWGIIFPLVLLFFIILLFFFHLRLKQRNLEQFNISIKTHDNSTLIPEFTAFSKITPKTLITQIVFLSKLMLQCFLKKKLFYLFSNITKDNFYCCVTK